MAKCVTHKEYRLLGGPIEKVQVAVQEHLNAGWTLVGGPAVSGDQRYAEPFVVQAVLKEEGLVVGFPTRTVKGGSDANGQ